MKVWITKYALTAGIREDTAHTSDNNGYIFTGEARKVSQIFTRKEWHTTRQAAIADANRRRDARITALRKQIAALEKMTFE